jgi:hypothetical protein
MNTPRVQLEGLYREAVPALLAYFRRQPALAAEMSGEVTAVTRQNHLT